MTRSRVGPIDTDGSAGRRAVRVGLLAVTGLCVMAQMYVTIPLTGVLSRELGADHGWTGLAVTTFALACAVGFLIFGPLSDRLGRRAVIVPGLVAFGLITAGVGLSDTLVELHTWRVLQGLACGTFSPPAVAYVNQTLPSRVRASATASLTTGYLLATVVGQLYAEMAAPIVGWRGVFFASAPVYLVTALLVSRLPAEGRGERSTAWWRAYSVMAGLWSRPELRVGFLAGLPLLLTIVALYAGLATQLAGSGDLLGLRLAAAPGMLLALMASRAVNRYGAVPVFRSCMAVAAAALFGAALGGTWSLVTVTAVAVVALAFGLPTLLSLVGARAGHNAGAAMAISTFLTVTGASIGPPTATILLATVGLRGMFGVLGLLVLASGVVLSLHRG